MNTAQNTIAIPTVVSTREVLQRGVGLKIGKVQTIKMPDGSMVEVDFWFNYTPQNVVFHHVGEPRKI